MENFNQKKSKSRLPKRPVFETTMRNLAVLGISPILATQAYPFNVRIFIGFLILGSSISSSTVYIIYDAKTFLDYTQAIFAGSFATMFILFLLIVIHRVEILFDFFKRCDAFIKTSKSEEINRIFFLYFQFSSYF